MNVITEIEKAQLKKELPKFGVGDTVRVHFRIVEGEKERIQVFEGVVIARSHGESAKGNFTVRRVAYSEGVERVFPLHSPRVERVEVVREGHVRRAKLHYLRERSGKAARVRAKARGTAMLESGEVAIEVVDAPDPAPVEDTAVEAASEETAGSEEKRES